MAEKKSSEGAWKVGIWAFVLVGLGIWMIINPDAAAGADTGGRRALLKTIFAYGWSVPGGIVAILIGTLCGWRYRQLMRGDARE